ncbi:hypothetical protein GCM10010174_87280 [Kutzneria viridogrisea]
MTVTCTASAGETFCAPSPGTWVTFAGWDTAAGDTFCSVDLGGVVLGEVLELHEASPTVVTSAPNTTSQRWTLPVRLTVTPSPRPGASPLNRRGGQLPR